MRRILRICLLCCILFSREGGICYGQDIKEVSGIVSDKTDKRPLQGVKVFIYNTIPEAQDAIEEIKRVKEAKGYLYLDALSVETNEEGYYTAHVAMTGALVFFTDMADPELQKVDGRLEINVSMLVGEILKEVVITAQGGDEPLFDVPEFDGESINGGVRFPLKSRIGKENARLVFQTYMIETGSKDTVMFRKPKVMDGEQYHQTQLRRMGFNPENDPLYLMAEENECLTENTKSIEWKDSVPIPDVNKVYFYNCRMWIEDYNREYYSIADTTIFRSDKVRQPMKFLDYSTKVYNLDPNEYRKQARRERRESAGQININFPMGKATIDPEDISSANELDKMRRELLAVASGEGSTLKELHIVGTASPEGNYGTNVALAKQRMSTIMSEVTSLLPKSIVDRTYKTMDARVAEWSEIADILEKDSLNREADEIRSIVSNNPNRDNQMAAIRRLPYYNDIIVPALPKLRSVNYTSVVEVFRELTPEEILNKYEKNKSFDFALYEYWNLFNMVKDEDELVELYKRAIDASSHTKTPWLLPANNLATVYINRGISDTNLLAPFLDLRFKVNFRTYNDGKLENQLNQEELVANQVIMMLMSKKYKRAGQYAMLLPDEGYHELKLFTRCLAGYWKKDAGLREEIIATSPQNAVVMLLASEKIHQAFAMMDSLDMNKAVSPYLAAQVLCRKYHSFSEMRDDYDEETFMDSSDIAADFLVKCFRMDSSFIDVARADFDIYDKLLEKALDLYEKGTVSE